MAIEPQAGTRNDLTDTVHGNIEYRQLPGGREQQFVIITTGQCVYPFSTFADRHLSGDDLRTDIARAAQMTEVLQQTVGHIDGARRDSAQRNPCAQTRLRLKITLSQQMWHLSNIG